MLNAGALYISARRWLHDSFASGLSVHVKSGVLETLFCHRVCSQSNQQHLTLKISIVTMAPYFTLIYFPDIA